MPIWGAQLRHSSYHTDAWTRWPVMVAFRSLHVDIPTMLDESPQALWLVVPRSLYDGWGLPSEEACTIAGLQVQEHT